MYAGLSLNRDIKHLIFLNTHAVLNGEGFLNLPVHLLAELLASCDFVASEADIYLACLKWGRARCRELGRRANGMCPGLLTRAELRSVRGGRPALSRPAELAGHFSADSRKSGTLSYTLQQYKYRGG